MSKLLILNQSNSTNYTSQINLADGVVSPVLTQALDHRNS